MTTRRSIACVSLLLALFGGLALAQEITVFEDGRYGGRSESYRSAVPNLLSESWNDRISSVRVESGRWELCKTEEFRDCQTVDRDTPDLRTLGLNDAISSLRPVREQSSGGGERPSGSVRYDQERSEFAVQQVYRALLGRDGDADGVRQGVEQFMEGRSEPWIRSVASSREFRDRSDAEDAEEILGQIYQGLLGRGMDTSGRDTYLRQIEQGKTADVVLEIMRSSEFRNRLP